MIYPAKKGLITGRNDHMMRKTMSLGVLGAALIIGGASTLRAEYSEGWRPWELSASLVELYDSNRDSTKTDKEALLESQVSVKAALQGSFARTEFNMYYSPSYRYRDNPRPNNQEQYNIYHDAGLAVSHRLTPRMKISASDAFNWTDEPAVMNQDLTVRESVTYRLNVAKAKASYELLPGRAMVAVFADHMAKRYLDDKLYAAIGDETAIGGGLSAGYLMRSGINVLTDVSMRQTDLSAPITIPTRPPTIIGEVSRDSTVVFGGLGLEKIFSAWQVRGRAGIDYAQYDNAAAESGSKPAGDFDLSYFATAATTLNLAIQYHTLRADISPYTVQQRTSVDLSVSHNFSDRLKASVHGIYAKGDYEAKSVAMFNGAPIEVGKFDGSDKVSVVSADVGYNVTRNVTVSAGAGYQNWSADEFLRASHNRFTGKVAVTASF